jgi:hypothetical protein
VFGMSSDLLPLFLRNMNGLCAIKGATRVARQGPSARIK